MTRTSSPPCQIAHPDWAPGDSNSRASAETRRTVPDELPTSRAGDRHPFRRYRRLRATARPSNIMALASPQCAQGQLISLLAVPSTPDRRSSPRVIGIDFVRYGGIQSPPDRRIRPVARPVGAGSRPRWQNLYQASLKKLPRSIRPRSPWIGTAARFAVGGVSQIHRHRPELCRSRRRDWRSPIPTEPIVFIKAPSHVGPNDAVVIPRGSNQPDWEVELAVIIGRRAKYVAEAEGADHVAGYAVCNDVSEREFQHERGGQWTKGKGCPTFGPLGPWLVTRDEIKDVQNLAMWLDVNGKRAQTGSTGP